MHGGEEAKPFQYGQLATSSASSCGKASYPAAWSGHSTTRWPAALLQPAPNPGPNYQHILLLLPASRLATGPGALSKLEPSGNEKGPASLQPVDFLLQRFQLISHGILHDQLRVLTALGLELVGVLLVLLVKWHKIRKETSQWSTCNEQYDGVSL